MATIGIDTADSEIRGANLATSKSVGHLRFLGARCTYGTTPDAGYKATVAMCEANGVPHFPYAFNRWNVATPEDQAHAALDAAYGSANPNWHGFPLCIDVEGNRNGLSAEQAYEWLLRFRGTVKSSIGVEPLLYTSEVYWADPAGMNGHPAPELKNCPGWIKYWPWPVHSKAVYDPAIVDALPPPPAPPFFEGVPIEQYMGDAIDYPGLLSTCDMDRILVVKQGDKGNNVKFVQRRVGAAVDGVFGPITAQKVKAFQISRGLVPDSIVGLDTWQALCWVAVP
jgi:peptidoglycan hydrolase-like protein with peptidoglycan-binding domain